jgi:hypothetical protein
VDTLLAAPYSAHCQSDDLEPKALIVPHAGYDYSGAIAAHAYQSLKNQSTRIKRIVLLGPAHRVALRGMALPTQQQFSSPLGEMKLDDTRIQALQDLPELHFNDAAHHLEHSLEVQLPFLQTLLPAALLSPIVVGEASPEAVAKVITQCWDEDTLIIVSTDMSHFLPYDQANAVDHQTIKHILNYDADIVGEQACGCHALNGLLLAAKTQKRNIRLLSYANSGDVLAAQSNKQRVVGYASFSLQ